MGDNTTPSTDTATQDNNADSTEKLLTQEQFEYEFKKRLAREKESARKEGIQSLAKEFGLNDDVNDVATLLKAIKPEKPVTPAPTVDANDGLTLQGQSNAQLQQLMAEIADMKAEQAKDREARRKLEIEQWKKQVVQEVKLPEFLTPQISGSSQEELAESAKALLAEFEAAIPKQTPAKGIPPVTHASAGNTPVIPSSVDKIDEDKAAELRRLLRK